MRFYLPNLSTRTKFILPLLLSKVQIFFGSKQSRYKLAAIIDLLLIIVILTHAKQPAQRLISPYVASLHSIYTLAKISLTAQTFAFVPDMAPNKFPYIDLQGLSYLSFFDVPLTDNGLLNYYSRGYKSFTSYNTQELFDRARYYNTKILLTLSSQDSAIIQKVLEDNNVKEQLANQAIDEIKSSNIDGITVDFEDSGQLGHLYSDKFTNFIQYLTNRIHSEVPFAQVAVALPNCHIKERSLYNIERLSNAADKLFLIASDFVVPEVKDANPTNPVYGFSEGEYWKTISAALGKFNNNIKNQKLVMERAWYGNGNNYPLYIPRNQADQTAYAQNYPVDLDQQTVERLVSGVPFQSQPAARKAIPLIVQALSNEGILDSNVLAYALATVEHETDETFEPIEEIGGRFNARRLGYEGGTNYFGRGYIQITHLRNYKTIGERIGLGDQLAQNPDLAKDPFIAARILAAFFKDNNVANLASQGSFVAARTPINPDYNGYKVADLAFKYTIY